jgi:hypothetical protein
METEFGWHFKEPHTLKRIFFMLVFAFILGFVRLILWVVILFQVGSKLLTGQDNPQARQLGAILAVYLYQIVLFLTFNTDQMPFPFAELESLGKSQTGKRR